jgi:DNA-binding NtrC family response regulator
VFLDEIGDIPLSIQAKILRVLQERQFERLGGNETIRSDVRVLAATNRNLEKAMQEGDFREDLYHRLNVVSIRVPPLRERREDIAELVHHFLERFAAELRVDKPMLADDAHAWLTEQPWPGNVRQLEHCIYRAMIFTRGYPVQTADLAAILGQGGDPRTAGSLADDETLRLLVERYLASGAGPRAHERFLEAAEKLLLEEALRLSKGNQTHAAQLLGLARPTLHAKIEKHGLGGCGR